jgi:hypothetical protein
MILGQQMLMAAMNLQVNPVSAIPALAQTTTQTASALTALRLGDGRPRVPQRTTADRLRCSPDPRSPIVLSLEPRVHRLP